MLDKIQKLREITGAGVINCQKALKESDGDIDKAIKIIHERGELIAAKKSARATGAGLLHSYIHGGRIGVLIEIRCETDFVAKSDDFKALIHNLAMQIAAMDPENVDDLLKQNYIKDESLTVEALVKQTLAKVGENIRVERFCRYEV